MMERRGGESQDGEETGRLRGHRVMSEEPSPGRSVWASGVAPDFSERARAGLASNCAVVARVSCHLHCGCWVSVRAGRHGQRDASYAALPVFVTARPKLE